MCVDGGVWIWVDADDSARSGIFLFATNLWLLVILAVFLMVGVGGVGDCCRGGCGRRRGDDG